LRKESIQQGILPQEGMNTLIRILAHRQSQVLISTQDFHVLVERRKAQTAPDLLQELEKAHLPPVTHARPTLGSAYVAPTSEIEQTIAGIWQEFLGVEQVGIHDNFFELGGHSLLLVQMRTEFQTRLGQDVTIVQLFEHPTIHDLAKYLSQAQAEKPALGQIEERGTKYRAALERQRQQTRRHIP
jgi:aryl carrier-like protein